MRTRSPGGGGPSKTFLQHVARRLPEGLGEDPTDYPQEPQLPERTFDDKVRARIAERLELEKIAEQQAGLQGGTEENTIEVGSQSGTEDDGKFEEIEDGDMEEDDPAMAAIVKSIFAP